MVLTPLVISYYNYHFRHQVGDQKSHRTMSGVEFDSCSRLADLFVHPKVRSDSEGGSSTPLKFNSSTLKKMGGWKTSLFYWVSVTFQGRTGNCWLQQLEENHGCSLWVNIGISLGLVNRQIYLKGEIGVNYNNLVGG